MFIIQGERVYGSEVDPQSRCLHYHSSLDIISIKFKCCGRWFPCLECHTEVEDHTAEVWPVREFNEKAVLCGSCGHQLTVSEYFDCGSICPSCQARFNPGCAKHYHLYFEQESEIA
jgi:uncharacterized CHY-type Zn-finger protein